MWWLIGYFPLWQGFFNQPFIFVRQYTQFFRVIYFISQPLLNDLSTEGAADIYGTADAFISKHFYLNSSSWNLYTKSHKGSVIEPYDNVPYGIHIKG